MMAEPFEAGQAPEPGDLPEPAEPSGADDAIEGTVVPFPRQPSTEVEPKRKPGGPPIKPTAALATRRTSRDARGRNSRAPIS